MLLRNTFHSSACKVHGNGKLLGILLVIINLLVLSIHSSAAAYGGMCSISQCSGFYYDNLGNELHSWDSAYCRPNDHETVIDAHNHIVWNHHHPTLGGTVVSHGCGYLGNVYYCLSTIVLPPGHWTGWTAVDIHTAGGWPGHIGGSGFVTVHFPSGEEHRAGHLWECASPAGAESCDGIDNTCDCAVDTSEVDNDGDQWMACDECDDSDPEINPGAPEGPFGDPLCSDFIDNDCDGLVDYPSDPGCKCSVDVDDDKYGSCVHCPSLDACDCDDSNRDINPGAQEECGPGCGNGIDENCSGEEDETCCTPPDGVCSAYMPGIESAEASSYQLNAVYGYSDLVTQLTCFLFPIGAGIAFGVWRRKRQRIR